jgi:hypothetical protein
LPAPDFSSIDEVRQLRARERNMQAQLDLANARLESYASSPTPSICGADPHKVAPTTSTFRKMNEKSITALPFNPTIGEVTTFLRAAAKLSSQGSFGVPLEAIVTQADEPAVADIANFRFPLAPWFSPLAF